MQHFQKTIAYLEEIEKQNSNYTLTEEEVIQVCNFFHQDRNIANRKRRKLENEVWKVRARSNCLLREETAKENSPESAKYLGKLIQDRIHAVQTESAILDAFDTDFLTERAMVLDRFARYELNPERKHR